MRTKLLYVIVSSNNDIYLEQAYVSMYSARKHINKCKITILTDTDTESTFLGHRKQFVSLADEIISIDLKHIQSTHHRSRILKTGARKYVSGNFLFIDTDTVILRDLSEIDNHTFSLAACLDSHSSLTENPYRSMILSHVKAFSLDINNEEIYFNSGVIYSKDDDISHDFYNKWQILYEKGRKNNVSMDQPSFCVANHEMNKVINILPDVWNCELKHGVKYLQSALILHYLCTNISRTGDKQIHLFNEKEHFISIKESGVIPERILECIENPFTGLNSPSTLVAGIDNQLISSKCYLLLKKHPSICSFIEQLFDFLVALKRSLKSLIKHLFIAKK